MNISSVILIQIMLYSMSEHKPKLYVINQQESWHVGVGEFLKLPTKWI